MRSVREMLEGYNGIEVDSVGRSGGLAFLWKKEVDCSFVSASVHYMDFHVKSTGGEWRVTGFYGWPSVSDRHLSWELLRVLARQSTLPWVCIGDFNEILFSTEMKGGSRPQRQMNNFQAAVDDCGLRDITWEGYNFSFDNGQAGDDNRQCMLDRAMCTNEWLEIFPFAKLFYLEREWSDHAPIKLCLNYRELSKGSGRAFKFEQIWVGTEGCEDAIRRGVEKGHEELVNVLRECASELQEWKKTNIHKIKRLIDKKRRQIAGINRGNRGTGEVNRRKKLVAEVADLMRQEEMYWRQRSRALWLKDGDRNTRFFHTCASERKRKNWIGSLRDDEGVVRQGDEAVARVANSYFQGLFTTANPVNFDDALGGLEGRVTAEMNMGLERDYCEEEVLDALNQMNPLKAPGPDGMNGLFYQTYWSIIGPEVIRHVLQILRGTRSPREINKTNIVLIPKKKAPDKIQDFRPISLCNVVYKLVSKVLANRLKCFLDNIVSENQSAFTPGRAISDNVLTAFEMFHYMKNSKSTEGYMAIKLDMAKAYLAFSVLINGTPTREFQPSRGLRQGDPLSPYLFILCAEVFSNLIKCAVVNNSLHGIRNSQSAPMVSHLFFADDSLIFLKANLREAEVITNIIRRYEDASGQLVNLEKTTVSFSKGVNGERKDNIVGRLGMVVVAEQSRYLGLPTVVGHSKKVLTDIIRDKLSKRLQGWRGKTLSRAGKEVLLKAVANSLPTYVMSIFKIPANFCNDLKSLVSRFWWGHGDGKRGLSWVAWHKLCQPKCKGGMGFRDFRLFNLSLLGKQVWRLMTNPECLWARIMKAKYYPNEELMSASIGGNPSYTWRGIIEARDAVFSGFRRRIGDGLSTRVWGDAWIPSTHTGKVLSPCPQGYEHWMVADLLGDGAGGWNEEKLAQVLLPFECSHVASIRLSHNRPPDEWYWCAERDGIYTVKSAYCRLAGENFDMGETSDWEREKWLWNRLWNIPVWPRIKLFFWQLCSEALATKANIVSRIGGEYPFCSFCHSNFESSLHIMRDCWVAQQVWEGIGWGSEGEFEGGRVRDWVEARWRELGGREQGIFMVVCWAIWEHRNKVVFDGVGISPACIIRRVHDVLHEIEGGGVGGVLNGGVQGPSETAQREDRWVAAPRGSVKVNVDTGVKEGEGVGVGVVCRDEDGEVMWGMARAWKEEWEPCVAEAVAVLKGLQEAKHRGHEKVIIESDCAQVIETLNRRKRGRSVFFLVVNDILALASSFTSISWMFTRRANNNVAHALAHLFPRVVGKSVWSEVLPPIANAAEVPLRKSGARLDPIVECENEEGECSKNILKLTVEDVKDEVEYWKLAIYGYVMGANPPREVLHSYLRRIWSAYEIAQILFLPNGLFVVRFAKAEHHKLVLANSMFLFDGKPIILKPWDPSVRISKISVKKVPIWVKLVGLDLMFWGAKCLEKLVGLVGCFVRIDDSTLEKSLLGFARVMVEVELDQSFPSRIVFEHELGFEVSVSVNYD
ncbi:uncharacterized protein LOC141613105 [Silene latifolia]|uniref:uncharacterized protein LOC141613105 n=1 Tax=Silene latifolia TaxID=37657 RepID=UPI003D77DED3